MFGRFFANTVLSCILIMECSLIPNIVAARINQPMYRLTLLATETLQPFPYSGNPWTDTVPALAELLSHILDRYQSHGTILRHLNENGAYVLSSSDTVGNPLIVIITHLPK